MNKNETNCLSLLNTMINDMQHADPLYSPTDFWSVCIAAIIDEIKRKGLSGFRAHKSANSFFVPLYSRPFYYRHKDIIDHFIKWLDTLPYRKAGTDIYNLLSGHTNALADYRVFKAADSNNPPILSNLSESQVGHPNEQFVFEDCRYSLSFLNYLKGLVFLKKNIVPNPIHRALEIGGGYGTLGEILLKSEPDALYIDVDLPPVAAVATYYLREVFGESSVLGYDQTREWEHIDIDNIPDACRAVVLCPWQLPKLRGKIDLFANFISFQEMEPDVVKNYINLVQSHEPEYILLRNLREGKRKKMTPDELGVKEPILLKEMIFWFDQYKEVARDTISFGELKIDNFHSEISVLTKK
ncbi:putative sugar O-methyltransferase [Desulfobacter sp.]|uniref:putative sugar O-methyltransferase n=1 Tax=Desulfobacter sp. TaxID=2294 RepID=UPI003D0DBFCC